MSDRNGSASPRRLNDDDAGGGQAEHPGDGVDPTALSNSDLWLSAEEARQVAAALLAVLEPYRDRSLGDRPDGTRRVRVMNMVVPHRRH